MLQTPPPPIPPKSTRAKSASKANDIDAAVSVAATASTSSTLNQLSSDAATVAEENEVVEIVNNQTAPSISTPSATGKLARPPVSEIDMLPEKVVGPTLHADVVESGPILALETAADRAASGSAMEGIVEGNAFEAEGHPATQEK